MSAAAAAVSPCPHRQAVLAQAQRLVIKVGSRLLMGMPGVSLPERIGQLAAELAYLRAQGKQVILVTSGAIGTGMQLTKCTRRPKDLPHLQALAAVGQGSLMSYYGVACQALGFHCGQMLLSADDVQDRGRHLNVRNCLNALLEDGIIPIINENDTVSVEEIRFGDNDTLAALVGSLSWADVTILLTTVDGVLKRQPDGSFGERLSVVRGVPPEVRALAGGSDDAQFSTGGMHSKLAAAEISTRSGEHLWIANGSDFGILRRLLAAEDLGTLFLPQSPRLPGNKRFLAFFTPPEGALRVDAGAARALRRQGRSLLPSGIAEVTGDFAPGDSVLIRDPEGQVVGQGLCNYGASDLRRIIGRKSSEIAGILGHCEFPEVIHRDNLVIHPEATA